MKKVLKFNETKEGPETRYVTLFPIQNKTFFKIQREERKKSRLKEINFSPNCKHDKFFKKFKSIL